MKTGGRHDAPFRCFNPTNHPVLNPHQHAANHVEVRRVAGLQHVGDAPATTHDTADDGTNHAALRATLDDLRCRRGDWQQVMAKGAKPGACIGSLKVKVRAGGGDGTAFANARLRLTL